MRDLIKLACIVALTIAAFAVLLELNSTLRDVHAHTVVTLENLDRNLIVLGVTLTEVQRGAKEWETASKIQASTSTQLLHSVDSTVAELRRTVANTDAQLNGSLLPALTASLTQQNSALASNQQTLESDLSALSKLLVDADAQIADPAIAQSLANIQASTGNLNAGIQNLTGVTADAKNLADYEVKQLETPEKVWLSVLKFVLGYGADARGLFVGYK